MNRRRDDLRAMLMGAGKPAAETKTTSEAKATPETEVVQETKAAPEVKAAPPSLRIRSTDPEVENAPRAASGAVKAMGLSLGRMQREASETARALEEKSAELDALRAGLVTGGQVVELDPARLDASFAADRLGGIGEKGPDDPDFAAFVEDIRAHGQQVPILVRPHPTQAGHYQIAYGHRRWRAAERLGAKVRALIRPLSDIELVVAQGQENAQRRDLSFIEKAAFALALDQRGFDRATLCAALAVQTAEVTRLLNVARAVPADLIMAIGPAPKAGRPRWLQLVEGFARPGAAVRIAEVLASDGFRHADSDQRFVRVFEAVFATEDKPAPRAEAVLSDAKGRPIARLETVGREKRLSFDEKLAPDFAALIISQLPTLYRDWQAGKLTQEQET